MKKIGLVLFSVFSAAVPVFAQGVINAEAAAVNGEEQTMTFMVLLKQGGWTMWPLGLCSVAMVFFVVRNALMLRQKELLRPDLRKDFEDILREGRIKDARRMCEDHVCLMTAVLDAGLERMEESADIVSAKEAIEEAGNEQMVTFMKPINYLSIIGAISPMLGLLGTVSGMIKAFQSISASGMGKPEQLAGHIGEALITTAVGLTIAIPAMLAYFIFKNGFIKTMSSMERTISHFLNVYQNSQNR
ncbi:MAG: MotA/TolQ/ExbB proton channel family protein [Kiritimatiellales bacterium]